MGTHAITTCVGSAYRQQSEAPKDNWVTEADLEHARFHSKVEDVNEVDLKRSEKSPLSKRDEQATQAKKGIWVCKDPKYVAGCAWAKDRVWSEDIYQRRDE